MPAILNPSDFSEWLDGSHDEALARVRPYDGAMTEQVATPAEYLAAATRLREPAQQGVVLFDHF